MVIDKNSQYTSKMLETFQINVVSIVISGLIIAILVAWVDTLRAACAGAIDDCENTNRYKTFWRKVVSSTICTLIVCFIIVLIVTYEFQNK